MFLILLRKCWPVFGIQDFVLGCKNTECSFKLFLLKIIKMQFFRKEENFVLYFSFLLSPLAHYFEIL